MNIMKRNVLAALLVSSPLVAAAVEVSGNVTLASDYRFRGISQTDTQLAVQGGFDVAFENGVYVGTWGSNVDFANSLELDYYVGYAGDISEDVSFDVGYIYYDYPGTDKTARAFNSSAEDDYEEIYASISIQDFTLGVAYSDDYYLETGEFYYVYGDYSFALPYDMSLGLHYGYNDFEFSSDDSSAKDAEQAFLSDGEDSYSDYSVTVSKAVAGVDLSLSWVDTDLSESECFGTNWCDSTVVFAVSKSL
ncbi:MAG: TorF family putative porin [Porticoccaceae bacterium]|nr:TorF family putative porin [Porticoccaceae bacterium]